MKQLVIFYPYQSNHFKIMFICCLFFQIETQSKVQTIGCFYKLDAYVLLQKQSLAKTSNLWSQSPTKLQWSCDGQHTENVT